MGIVLTEMLMAARRERLNPTDLTDLQPEQRLHEVAAILAAGVIRMRVRRCATSSRHGTAACKSQISPESGETRLELSRRSSPDGQCG
ncbi:MAG: hypothetical protein BroJett003_06100 [Planctomycetota bacterium]|nr:MAG: hypothetical protein BroJett003_06100 [Planctomycetota bacterium]